MVDLFPELKNLRGGRKQQWVNEHLQAIAALNSELGFQKTAQLLNMKPETLVKALSRAERKPVITEANKAMNRGLIAERKADEAHRKINAQAEAFIEHVDNDERMRDNLTRYFIAQSAINEMMAQLMLNENTKRNERDLTYPINCKSQRKVSPTSHKPLFPQNKKRSGYLISQGVSFYPKSIKGGLQCGKPRMRRLPRHGTGHREAFPNDHYE